MTRRAKPARPCTVDELRVKCLEANAVLNSYGIFEQVDILCDAGPDEHPDTAKVKVELKEKTRLKLNAGAYVSQSREGSMEAGARAHVHPLRVQVDTASLCEWSDIL